jgi:DNA-binding CsgD family transcriptional regulator
MADIQTIQSKFDPKNEKHSKILNSLEKTLSLYEKLINEVDSAKTNEMPNSVDRILTEIDANTEFNIEMIRTKDRRGQLPVANQFKINAVVSAIKVASTIEDFTRIEIVPINSKSESAQKALFVARNIDGVLESSIANIVSSATFSDITLAIKALEAKGDFEGKIVKSLDALYKDVSTQLDNGIGTRYQLLTYNRDKAREQLSTIIKLLEAGKTIEEISTELNISVPGIKSIENEAKAEIDKKIIEAKKAEIKKDIDAKKTYKEIAEKLGVDANRLTAYCKINNLIEYNEKSYIKDNLSKIEELLNAGKSFEEIANTLNVNQARLKSIAENNKLNEVKKAS